MTDTNVVRLVELLALVPAFAMVVEVSCAGKLQWLDYWYVLIRMTSPDGSFRLGGIFTPQNEHPLMVPSLLYWLDARLADGDNRVLGYVVIVIAAVILLLLRTALPKTLPPLVRAGLVVAMSGLIFSLQGMHMFVRSMSGSAWLTANLIVVISLLLANKGRWRAALLTGVLASASYGTAFALWPVLALLATLRKERRALRIAPLAIGAVIIGIWYILKPSTWVGGTPADDIGSLLYTFLTIVGKMWTADNAGFAVVAGVLMLVAYVVLLTNKTAQDKSLWFWWTLGCYGILACGMIATARLDFGADFGLTSRYSALAAMVSIPLLVLMATVLYKGDPAQRPEDRGHRDRHRRRRVHPWPADRGLGCGGPELGSTIDLSDTKVLREPGTRGPTEPVGMVNTIEDRGEADLITGWVTGGTGEDTDQVHCTIVVDGDGKVVGGGVSQLTRSDITNEFWSLPPDVGFKVIGPVSDETRIVVVHESGAMRWLPPVVTETEDGQ